MCFCCLSYAFSFQSIGRDNTFRLINANQPARISPLATVVTQTAHQIPSTPMPMRTNRMASEYACSCR